MLANRMNATAAIWLYLVAAATLLNSLILNRSQRFIDLLVGLSFTQFVDAMFLGVAIEPQGSPDWWVDALPALIIDALFLCVLLVLAVKVSHGSRAAAKTAFWAYSLDTLVFALIFFSSIWMTVKGTLHASATALAWQGSTVAAHIVGIVIISRALRAGTSGSKAIPT